MRVRVQRHPKISNLGVQPDVLHPTHCLDPIRLAVRLVATHSLLPNLLQNFLDSGPEGTVAVFVLFDRVLAFLVNLQCVS